VASEQWTAAGHSRPAHPGYASTNLQSAAPLLDRAVMAVTNRLLGQTPEMGALPELYAATRPNLDGGLFIGHRRQL
jgi:hypothetical protein